MSLRLRSFLTLAFILFVQFPTLLAEAAFPPNQENPTIHVDFDACVSYLNGYNSDYSEFTGVTTSNPNCSVISLVGGYVYRNNPEVNTHSCTPGQDSIAMCISGLDSCDFVEDDSRALRFDVLVVPGPEGFGSIEDISFYSQAPENFNFVDGVSGPNNYPTLMGIRVTANGSEVYRETGIATSRNWSFSSFDFSNVAGFRVEVPTLFNFEILPYCLVGVDSDIKAWDIDELTISGGCNDVNGGIISVDTTTTICYPDSQNVNSVRTFTVDMEFGSSLSWIVANAANEITLLTGSGTIDFNQFDNGIYNVYHIAYDSTDIQGLVRGGLVQNILGCFDLSNSIQIFNNKLEAGQLTGNGQDSLVVCLDIPQLTGIDLELTGAVGIFTNYFLLDSNDIILEVTDQPFFDISSYGDGNYSIVAASHNGEMFNGIAGMDISALTGCFVLSNFINVEKLIIDAGVISFDGEDDFQACETSSFILTPTLEDTMGGTSRWILYMPNGLIVSVYEDTPIDISMMLMSSLRLVHISYVGNISGLEAGGNISTIMGGCFDFSNVLSIDIPEVDGGEINVNGLDSLSLCLNDPGATEVVVDIDGVQGTASALFVTDEDGEILVISNSDTLDFSNAGNGICFIWNMGFANTLDGFEIGMNVDSIVGCYDLSEPITVNRVELVPAELSANNGETSFEICSGDGVADSLIFDASGFNGPFTQLVITDDQNNVLELPASDTVNFEGVPDGLCFVYHLVSTEDSLISGSGVSLDSLEGCFVLSNAVSVLRTEVDGGTIMTTDSLTEVTIVIGDGSSTVVDVILESEVGDSSAWVITDSLGVILELPAGPPFDFESAGTGVCLIWHLSYSGDIEGLEVGESALELEGCFDLSNAITVDRIMLVGGVIEYDNGQDTVLICTGDPIVDTIDVVLTGAEGPLSGWIITDTSGLILELPSAPPFAFDNVPTGICQIWHISYVSGLEGLEEGMNVSGLDGSFNLSNALVVDRTNVNGGMIMTTDSLTSISICTGDGIADSIDIILSGFEGDSTAWIITDTSGVILELPAAPPFDFEGVPPGTCFIYHVAFYEGTEGIEQDSLISNITGCYDLSNAVTVFRFEVEGGIISEASGLDTLEVVIGEGVIDSFEFSVIDAEGDSLKWVITDDAGIIISISDNPPVDFESAGQGTCHLYHIAYGSDDVGLELGEDINNLSGCFDLSNVIVVERIEVNGGMIMTVDSLVQLDLCIQDSVSTPIDILLDGNIGTDFQWVITDTAGLILDLPATPPFDFSMAPTGICLIWHLASIDPVMNLGVGNNVADVTGIFDLSNPIEVDRTQVSGGVISHSSGSDTISIVTNDGIADLIDLDLTGNSGDSSQWIITSDQGVILSLPMSLPFDFEGSPAGTCLIWNISFDEVPVGLEIDSSAFDLAGCFDLSNAFTVIRQEINGGSIITTDSLLSVDLCLNDTLPNVVDVILTDTFGMNYAWLITDANGLILELPMNPPFDFSGAPDGICQIWHMAYQDNLMGLAEGNNVSDLIGSYNLSNSIEVVRDSLAGGMLTLDNGEVNDTITVGDGIIDTLSFVLTDASGDNTIFVITDTLGMILDTTSLSEFDLESAGGGVCLVWNLSYSDGLSGLEKGNNASDLSGCFDLSNPVTIVREGLMGGNLTTANGMTSVALCLSDTLPDLIEVMLTDTVGPVHTWVITDTSGLILDLPAAPPFDVTALGVDTCQIWNLTHEPTISGLMVGNNVSALMGNFNFSNAINVGIDNNTASMIMTTDSLTAVTITVGEGVDDLIDVISEGGDSELSSWVITDTLGNIMELPAVPPFNFENAGGGVCLIWEINYSAGISGLSVGANVSTLDGCFVFSNPIEVTRIPTVLNGGFLTTTDFQTSVEICVGNGNSPDIDVMLSNNVGPNFSWVITDTTGLILGLPMAPPFDLSLAGPGLCQIWNISYSNGLTGLAVGENIDGLMGFFDFSNAISVTRNAADGGTIQTPNGFIEVTIPVGEGVIDSVDVVLSNNDGEFQQWLITDTSGLILDINAAPPFTFEEDGGGVCLIWSLSYSGAITGVQEGLNVMNIEGCFDFSNSITVNKDGVNGGTLTTADGSTTAGFCFTDAFADSLALTLTDTIGTEYQWIVADGNGAILALPADDPIDLSGLPEGTCFVYNIAYDMAPMGLVVGDTLTNLSGIYHLSNAVSVNKVSANGGSLTYADGTVLDSIQVGEGVIDTINVLLTGNSGTVNQWVVTDTFGMILDLPVSDPFDFEDAGGGVCLIWNIAFEPGLQGLVIGGLASQLDGCYSLSNPITLVKDGLNGGLLTFDDMSFEREICFGDGVADPTTFIVQGTQGMNQELLITRTDGQIFSLDIPNPFNFEVIPINIDSFLIYNIAYDTLPGGYSQGSFIDNLTGNFNLSNSVLLRRNIQKGGSFEDQNGNVDTTLVVADGIVDTLTMNLTGEFADSLVWIIANESDTIIDFQSSNVFVIDSSGSETCHIYHIGFDPMDIQGLEIGLSVDSLVGCYGLSNRYTLAKKALNGGILTTSDGSTSVDLCLGDDNTSDVVNVITEGELGAQFVFIVVNTNGIILLNQTSSQIDFSAVQPGDCQIFNLSHDGSLMGLVNGVNIVNLTGCFTLSNPIDVTKDGVFGGNLNFQPAGTEMEVCVGDATPDNLIWTTTSSVSAEYAYAITDTFNVIDTVLTSGTFDFNDTEVGTCRIWGISYIGTLVAQPGDTVGVDLLVEECFDISNDFLTVNKVDCPVPQSGIDYRLFPNPVVDQLRVDITSMSKEEAECLIFDANGKVLHRKNLALGMHRFDVSSFQNGIYYMRIRSGGHTSTEKFVILR